MLVDPVEGGIDKEERGVAIRSFCTVFAGGTVGSVASLIIFGGCVSFVEGIRVEVCLGMSWL